MGKGNHVFMNPVDQNFVCLRTRKEAARKGTWRELSKQRWEMRLWGDRWAGAQPCRVLDTIRRGQPLS